MSTKLKMEVADLFNQINSWLKKEETLLLVEMKQFQAISKPPFKVFINFTLEMLSYLILPCQKFRMINYVIQN